MIKEWTEVSLMVLLFVVYEILLEYNDTFIGGFPLYYTTVETFFSVFLAMLIGFGLMGNYIMIIIVGELDVRDERKRSRLDET